MRFSIPPHSFFKYTFLFIALVVTSVFITTGKPLKLIGEALQTIAPEEAPASTAEKRAATTVSIIKIDSLATQDAVVVPVAAAVDGSNSNESVIKLRDGDTATTLSEAEVDVSHKSVVTQHVKFSFKKAASLNSSVVENKAPSLGASVIDAFKSFFRRISAFRVKSSLLRGQVAETIGDGAAIENSAPVPEEVAPEAVISAEEDVIEKNNKKDDDIKNQETSDIEVKIDNKEDKKDKEDGAIETKVNDEPHTTLDESTATTTATTTESVEPTPNEPFLAEEFFSITLPVLTGGEQELKLMSDGSVAAYQSNTLVATSPSPATSTIQSSAATYEENNDLLTVNLAITTTNNETTAYVYRFGYENGSYVHEADGFQIATLPTPDTGYWVASPKATIHFNDTGIDQLYSPNYKNGGVNMAQQGSYLITQSTSATPASFKMVEDSSTRLIVSLNGIEYTVYFNGKVYARTEAGEELALHLDANSPNLAFVSSGANYLLDVADLDPSGERIAELRRDYEAPDDLDFTIGSSGGPFNAERGYYPTVAIQDGVVDKVEFFMDPTDVGARPYPVFELANWTSTRLPDFYGEIDGVKIADGIDYIISFKNNELATSDKPATLIFQYLGSVTARTKFYLDPVSTDSLVGYWKFDEISLASSSSTADSSGDGNTGTAVSMTSGVSGPTSTVPTTAFSNGKSMSFDGVDDYISTSLTKTYIPTTGDVTIAGWFYSTHTGADDEWVVLSNMNNSPSYHNIALSKNSSDKFFFNNYDGSEHRAVANAATINQWVHVAGVRSSNTNYLYINGAVQSAPVASGTPNVNAGITLVIGKAYYLAKGLADDVRIYNRALSASEISDLASGNHASSTWTGASSSTYAVAANWSTGAIPDPYTRVIIGGATSSILTASEQMAGLTINASSSLDLAGYNLTLNDSGTFTNNGTLLLKNTETLTGFTNSTSTGTVLINATSSVTGLKTGNTYNNLTLSATSTTQTLNANLTINGNLTLNAGTLATASNTITIAGNWINNGGTFTAGTSTVTLSGTNQTLSGTNSFYNLTKSVSSAATLTFPASATTTITNTLSLSGAASQLLSLRSSTTSTQWKIDPQGTRTLSYLDVQDSNNTSASAIDALGINATDSGNNTNWTFTSTDTTSASGYYDPFLSQKIASLRLIQSVASVVNTILTFGIRVEGRELNYKEGQFKAQAALNCAAEGYRDMGTAIFSNDISSVRAGEILSLAVPIPLSFQSNHYCFRLVKADGSLLGGYEVVADFVPTVVAEAPQQPLAPTLIPNDSSLVAPVAPITIAVDTPYEAPFAFRREKEIFIPSAPLTPLVVVAKKLTVGRLVGAIPAIAGALSIRAGANMPSISSLQAVNINVAAYVNLPVGMPVARIPVTALRDFPTNFVLARNPSDEFNLDLRATLSPHDKTIESNLNLVVGQSFKLVVKPAVATKEVYGHIIISPKNIARSMFSGLMATVVEVIAGPAVNPEQKRLIVSTFKYKKTPAGVFQAVVQAPLAHGTYEIKTFIVPEGDERRVEELTTIAVVDPEGYVYEESNGREIRVADARVTLEVFNPAVGRYEEWSAKEYYQKNPQVTAKNGTYVFLVPQGTYRLVTRAKGYYDFISQDLNVAVGSPIHFNVKLEKKGPPRRIKEFIQSLWEK